MMKNLAINELKTILNFYNVSLPDTLHKIKTKANKIIVKKLCVSNFNFKYKKLLIILNKKRIITHQKKSKHEKTKKHYTFIFKDTRVRSPIRYLDA